MLAQSTSVLDTIQEAFLPEGAHKPHHLTVSLEGALGTTDLRARLQGAGTAVPTWEASPRPDRKKEDVCAEGAREGKHMHYLPFCLKKLSSKSRSVFRILFFSSLIS